MIKRRWVAQASLVIAGAQACVASTASPGLSWNGCAEDAIGRASAARMQCGWLNTGVRLNGVAVRLRVSRLLARPDRPSRHPVIYVPGGPGDPGGQTGAALRAWRGFQQRAAWPRDLVIFDPRGTGRSRPRPSCPKAALENCFKRLGLETAKALSIDAQVADLHRLIQAIDAGRAVLWAESFGAVIARRLQARHPADVQALVLDSPVLKPGRIAQRRRAELDRRRRQLMAGCLEDLGCRLGVPSASALLDGLMARFAVVPQTLAWADVPRRPRTIAVDGQALIAMLLLSGDGPVDSRALIARLRRSLAEPAALVPLAVPVQRLADRGARTAPVYWSSRCAAPDAHESTICRQWPVAPVAPMARAAPVSTLVLAGSRDVLTPLDVSARFVLDGPQRQLLVVQGAAHGIVLGNACAQGVVRRFLVTEGAWLGAPVCRAVRHSEQTWPDAG